MWAIVKNKQVIQLISNPRPVVVNDTTHSKDIFIHWTKAERKKIGVYDFIPGEIPDNRFETPTTVSYKVDDSKGTVTETINKKDKVLDDKTVDGIVTKGVKTIYTEQIQNQAASLLAPTDWMIVRKAEDSSKSVPSAVTTYRASVRTEADKIVKAIDDCDTLDKLKALFVTEYNKDGSVKTLATMQTLPSDKDIEEYKR
jgi:hypothetical protein